MPGDADGDHRVTRDDARLIRRAFGSQAGKGRYLVSADADLDGRISSRDLRLWSQAYRQSAAAAPQAKALAFASYTSSANNNDPAAIDTSPTAPTGTIYDGIAAVIPQADVADAVYDEYAPNQFFETVSGLTQAASAPSYVETVQSRIYLFDLTKADAGYRNVIGIFKVDDASGRIDDGGTELLDPTNTADAVAYRAAAENRKQVVFSEGPGNKLVPKEKLVTIPDDWEYFSYYIHQNGNSTYQNGTSKVGRSWFAFKDVNADDLPHFRIAAAGTPNAGSIEVEDLSRDTQKAPNPWGEEGDADFNDAVFNFTAITDFDGLIDLDIDSDNNNGFGLPENSAWEEELEDNPYGLGKLIMQNYNTDDPGENAQSFTPITLQLPTDLGSVFGLSIIIDYDPIAAGLIQLWTANKGEVDQLLNEQGSYINPYQPPPSAAALSGGLRVSAGHEFSLSDLNYNPQDGSIVLWVATQFEALLRKTLKGVDEYGKSEGFITATLFADGQYLASDKVKYIVTQPDSFFYDLQFRQEVRTGLAATRIYDRDGNGGADLPDFSLELLDNDALEELGVPETIRTLLSNASGVDGFNAALYQDYIAGEDQYILSFAGTDDVADILTDVLQGLGEFTEQYDAALLIGDELLSVDQLNDGNLIFVGHSLGGGLASAAYTTSGFRTQTFNAAGLHLNTLKLPNGQERFDGSITRYNNANTFVSAFHVDEDLLTNAQEKLSFVIPVALGKAEDDLIGPYGVEIAAARTAIVAGYVAGQPWLVIVANVAEKVAMGLSHRGGPVMWGLLYDEATGDDRVGYEYGL